MTTYKITRITNFFLSLKPLKPTLLKYIYILLYMLLYLHIYIEIEHTLLVYLIAQNFFNVYFIHVMTRKRCIIKL